jgi:hypothetical protein
VLSSLSPVRRRFVLAMTALVAAAAVVVAAAVVTRARDGRARGPVAQGRPGPVLLVPGYGGSRSSLQPLAERLRAAGRTATVLALPGDGTGDLREAAGVVRAAADAAIRGGAPSVDVVGYSAGGVTARVWAAQLGGASVARRIVTLGAPHHGTGLAALGVAVVPGQCPAGCQELSPGSALLRALNRGDETPDGPEWTSVWTDQDTTVTPPDSARLAGATDVVVQQVCPGTSLAHGDLPTSSVVQAIVLEALGAGPARASYGPTDCARLSS